jgi:hypothetical protein
MSVYIILFISENLLKVVHNKRDSERTISPNKHCKPLCTKKKSEQISQRTEYRRSDVFEHESGYQNTSTKCEGTGK